MSDEEKNVIRQLSRKQRRVLGTLIEKGFTTPDQYPLTVKATTTGCNQKSNRDPETSYDESDVADALEELRQLGLVADVYADGSRAVRYRHYMRHRFTFSEEQLAIICELLLRGRQQLGELRTRASRMRRIDSQEQLREQLDALLNLGFLQSSGNLERRGVEVDHTFYGDRENMAMPTLTDAGEPESKSSTVASSTVTSSAVVAAAPVNDAVHSLQQTLEQLQIHSDRVQNAIDSLRSRLDRIERELGID